MGSVRSCSFRVSCYDDGTDCFDTATRISLYPDVELFNADGTTASGNESFVSAVTVNVGPAVSDMAWEASVPASAAWATVRRTTVASIFEEAAGGARHDLSADGIELVLQPNTEYRRTVVVTIAAADGTTADYEFTQLGQKADAAGYVRDRAARVHGCRRIGDGDLYEQHGRCLCV